MRVDGNSTGSTQFAVSNATSGCVLEKLRKEVALGRMGGPFPAAPFDDLVVSPLGVVPKKEPGKFRLIHHLSFPKRGVSERCYRSGGVLRDLYFIRRGSGMGPSLRLGGPDGESGCGICFQTTAGAPG